MVALIATLRLAGAKRGKLQFFHNIKMKTVSVSVEITWGCKQWRSLTMLSRTRLPGRFFRLARSMCLKVAGRLSGVISSSQTVAELNSQPAQLCPAHVWRGNRSVLSRTRALPWPTLPRCARAWSRSGRVLRALPSGEMFKYRRLDSQHLPGKRRGSPSRL